MEKKIKIEDIITAVRTLIKAKNSKDIDCQTLEILDYLQELIHEKIHRLIGGYVWA